MKGDEKLRKELRPSIEPLIRNSASSLSARATEGNSPQVACHTSHAAEDITLQRAGSSVHDDTYEEDLVYKRRVSGGRTKGGG